MYMQDELHSKAMRKGNNAGSIKYNKKAEIHKSLGLYLCLRFYIFVLVVAS